ncbi:ComF family protein [Congzhengia minquanensis]|uniref:ComF family protein n=1 Tax=Congzhengia minquanensis TaxID=2763657 RepID=A0A926DP24_9FIRM|nr:ComF family protein [Congzhengia minquanensis]MBC8541483.1 ComF family protein [Congzhengia minquanensis]
MFDKILSFLFPSPCVVCQKPAGRNRFVCNSCKEHLTLLKPGAFCKTCFAPLPSGAELCGKCLSNSPAYGQLVACVSYQGILRNSLHRYKFGGRSDLHTSFAMMMCAQLLSFGCTDFDVVVPTPLSNERLRERGFNQAELIAKDIAKQFHAPCVSNALKKCRDTERQSELDMHQRDRNVRGAFALSSPDAVREKKVLLVDDIFTTGATMREAAKTLSAVSKSVTACVLAKTDIRQRS